VEIFHILYFHTHIYTYNYTYIHIRTGVWLLHNSSLLSGTPKYRCWVAGLMFGLMPYPGRRHSVGNEPGRCEPAVSMLMSYRFFVNLQAQVRPTRLSSKFMVTTNIPKSHIFSRFCNNILLGVFRFSPSRLFCLSHQGPKGWQDWLSEYLWSWRTSNKKVYKSAILRIHAYLGVYLVFLVCILWKVIGKW
jgi:hypothetical protein